ncbi:MAG: hypothetical protein J4400_02010 [Candidatus Aenigmarchaeota archaeon]|nr:hypothetical protein [Candidatus Aenigmarchaeota archaeon]
MTASSTHGHHGIGFGSGGGDSDGLLGDSAAASWPGATSGSAEVEFMPGACAAVVSAVTLGLSDSTCACALCSTADSACASVETCFQAGTRTSPERTSVPFSRDTTRSQRLSA